MKNNYKSNAFLFFVPIVFTILIAGTLTNKPLNAQTIDAALRSYEQGDFERVKEVLPLLEARYSDRPEYLFLKAVFEEKGETAFTLYSEIGETSPDNPIYEKVLWRMCQYNYAKGLYVSAQDMVAMFLQRFPDSNYVNLATEMRRKLTRYLGERPPEIQQELLEEDKPVYTIQVGAFASNQNARRRLSYLRGLGIRRASIREHTVAGQKLFKIWVGEYEDMDDAREAGSELARRYRLSSVTVVEKKE